MIKLQPNGKLVTINNHNLHIYSNNNNCENTIVFLAGSATVAPVYDFKILYEKLSNNFNIVVIEKFGYGYSDIVDTACDIDSLVSINREAIQKANIIGPYILVPHSMSGLEAIRWKQKYPNEIKAIIGIDMATPLAYENWTENKIKDTISNFNLIRKLKLHYIPKIYPLSNRGLNKEEIKQQKALMKRNAFNKCYINEANAVLQNAKTIVAEEYPTCPTLLFSSNGEHIDKFWVYNQQKFADIMNAKLITYDCWHYIHYYKSEEMAIEINEFIKELV